MHSMVRNENFAIDSCDVVTRLVVISEDVEFRVLALDAVLRHDGLL